jgi:hypothetical protein
MTVPPRLYRPAQPRLGMSPWPTPGSGEPMQALDSLRATLYMANRSIGKGSIWRVGTRNFPTRP